MLNYFSNLKLKPTSDEYAIDLCEILCISKDAALVARGSFTDIKRITEVKRYMKEAIGHQLEANGYTFLELTLPCHWRLLDKPQGTITSLQVIENIEWFKNIINKMYPLKKYK